MKEYTSDMIKEIIEKETEYTIQNTVINDSLIYRNKNLKKLCFENVTFNCLVEFRGMNIDEVVFTNCIFKNKVIFSESALYGKVSFDDSIFEQDALFIRTIFGNEKNSNLNQIWFARAQFLRNVHFNGAQFVFHTHFNETTFFKTADFSEACFSREAMFIQSIFLDRAIFWEAVFNDKAFFIKTEFRHSANFNIADFKGSTSFIETHLELVDFRVKSVKNINFNHTTIHNSQMLRENIESAIEQEKNGDYAEAREIYIMLKNNFNSIGRYDDQSWAFLKEKEVERNDFLKNKKYAKYILSVTIFYLYGYGEKPLYTIRSSLLLTFIFALIYWYSGRIIPNMNNSLYTIPYKLTFSDSLYFSVVTFTTLGYGDWYPDPAHWVRYVVMLEAFVGIFMVGLFVFSITRRTANR